MSVALLITCIALSAFFSSLETAVTSLSGARLRKLMEENPSKVMALELWLRKPNYVLTTILVGNNVVNTLAASTATVLAQSIFESYAISAATFFITIILLIFGEVSPKTLARHNAEKIVPLSMTLLLPIYVLLWPITWFLSMLASRLVSMFGGSSSTMIPVTTKEDIAYMIRLGNEEGVFERADGHLLQSVIEFRETVAKESMVPRTDIGSFEVHASYEEVRERIIKEGHTRWPVYEGNIDNIIGIFHAKDLLRNLATNGPHNFSLRDFLRPAKFVPDMMKITTLLKEFQAGKAHLAVVVDEYGGTAGIISLEDVLEEIVGEIRDEYDDEELERTIQQVDPNNFMVHGRANIFELGKRLSVVFPESDAFDSLGGFLVAFYGSVPKIGTKITFGDCVFTIKVADEKKVVLVHIHQAGRGTLLHHHTKSGYEELAAA